MSLPDEGALISRGFGQRIDRAVRWVERQMGAARPRPLPPTQVLSKKRGILFRADEDVPAHGLVALFPHPDPDELPVGYGYGLYVNGPQDVAAGGTGVCWPAHEPVPALHYTHDPGRATNVGDTWGPKMSGGEGSKYCLYRGLPGFMSHPFSGVTWIDEHHFVADAQWDMLAGRCYWCQARYISCMEENDNRRWVIAAWAAAAQSAGFVYDGVNLWPAMAITVSVGHTLAPRDPPKYPTPNVVAGDYIAYIYGASGYTIQYLYGAVLPGLVALGVAWNPPPE
ncbi:MAG: hypothetical protein JW809_15000 [Pirellulales bacterium]|nr:hypothetical protein [Pirellulales bacterium]